MNLTLKRFSQDVDLEQPEVINYFLVFNTDTGSELRLPVQKETTEALVKMLYATEHGDTKQDDSEEVDEETTIEQELIDDMNLQNAIEEDAAFIPNGTYDSEEDIPSL